MAVNKNDFFRQATLRICSSLDIEKAMRRCLRLLEKFMPVSEMFLNMYEPGLGVIRNLAYVTRTGSKKPLPPTPMPKDAIRIIESRLRKWQDVMIVNRPELNPIFRTLFPLSDAPYPPSLLTMVLVVEGERLGALGIIGEGKKRFTKPHAHLISLLREPFAIAMSNALRYQEVLKLKDMVDAENRELSRELRYYSGDEIVGADYGLKGVMEMVHQVAPVNSPVMLLGETGVGKEVIANAIHCSSPRRDDPFIKVNCGAIPDNLLDSELFGHEKGAFTGAIAQKRGRFERADKGSIFLDEIAELPPPAQVRLLRVLQHKEFERVGGTTSLKVDVRIIAATHRNLEERVRTGAFREDLWYRINIFPITIPPLRQRKEDIPALVHHFVERKSKELKIHTPPSASPEEMERLNAYQWPGNVRELENLIERELIQSRGLIESGPLSFEHFNLQGKAEEISRGLPETNHKLLILDEAMSWHIRRALRLTKGKIYGAGGAAELLGINPNTLRSKMKKLGIPFGQKS